MNPLIYVLCAAALWYIPTAYALLKLEFSVAGFNVIKIEESKIYFQLKLKLENKTSFKINFQEMIFDMILNGTKIGVVSQILNTKILAKQSKIVSIDFYVDKDLVGFDFFVNLITNDFKNTNFELDGHVKANNKTFPYKTNWKIKDFISGTYEIKN